MAFFSGALWGRRTLLEARQAAWLQTAPSREHHKLLVPQIPHQKGDKVAQGFTSRQEGESGRLNLQTLAEPMPRGHWGPAPCPVRSA